MNQKFNQEIENRILDFIHKKFGFEVFTPGLERTEKIFKPFIEQLKLKGIKCITIAGTNGKGQTAHTLSELFKSAGCSVGLWTSPHILSIRERFHFEQDISYEELEQEIYSTAENLTEISFYEFLFVVFLQLTLKQKKIDYLILEVGLGGRLDAVNHVDADCAAITSISRDHQAILGNTLKEILAEKIAVSRPNKALFTTFSLEYLNDLTRKYCHQNNINWIILPPNSDYYQSNQILAESIFEYFLPGQLSVLKVPTTKFKGRHE